ncbi:MAG TPA: NAD-dependent epimerase/dehydratase family protein [Porticoccus sp.]|nr:NAD-dependent epimerase/dehydratase family protein [Porticoccus sp.]
MTDRHVGILGATSLVGHLLLPPLVQAQYHVVAYTRQACLGKDDTVEWRQLPPSVDNASFQPTVPPVEDKLPLWICAAPIWVLPEYFSMMEAQGVRRVVVLSSTSRYTKGDSSNAEEQSVANRLAEAETLVKVWAEKHGVEWIILRPTLIYGLGRDKNIAEIARFIRKFGFFPLFGKALGLRQPVHANDVAYACVSALNTTNGINRSYNISGGETLAYREMVLRIFKVLGKRPCVISVPLTFFRLAVMCLRLLPRYRHWSVAMAERMNQDLAFDHTEAAQDIAYNARTFAPTKTDVGAP